MMQTHTHLTGSEHSHHLLMASTMYCILDLLISCLSGALSGAFNCHNVIPHFSRLLSSFAVIPRLTYITTDLKHTVLLSKRRTQLCSFAAWHIVQLSIHQAHSSSWMQRESQPLWYTGSSTIYSAMTLTAATAACLCALCALSDTMNNKD